MKRIILYIFVVIVAAVAASFLARTEKTAEPQLYADLIKIDAPLPGTAVQSPLEIAGEARGAWYFEAVFPIWLLDGNGNEIARAQAQAQSDWMTTDFVPFRATLTFDVPAVSAGTLVVANDNPSGLPENAKEIGIPVKFASTAPAAK